MNRLVLSLVCSISVSFVAVSQAAPKWTRDCGLDFWNFRSIASGNAKAKNKSQDLAAQELWLKDHIDATDYIVDQLILGRMTLDEAVRETLFAQQDRPEWLINCRANDPSASSDQELIALALIRKVVALQEKARYLMDEEQEHLITSRLSELQYELQFLTQFPADERR